MAKDFFNKDLMVGNTVRFIADLNEFATVWAVPNSMYNTIQVNHNNRLFDMPAKSLVRAETNADLADIVHELNTNINTSLHFVKYAE